MKTDSMNADLLDWLRERQQNCERLAALRSGDEAAGWREDGSYFERAVAAIAGAQFAPAAPSGWNLVPDWVAFDRAMNVLTIHGKQYAAPLFGLDGFLAAPGTVLRIEDGPDGVVTCSQVAAAPAAQPADSAMEVLRELISEVEASKHMDDLAGRMQWVYERARALVAKETPHAR